MSNQKLALILGCIFLVGAIADRNWLAGGYAVVILAGVFVRDGGE